MERRSMEGFSQTGEATKKDSLEMHKRDQVEILSLEEISGETLEQLAEKAIQEMTVAQKPSEGFLLHMRKKLGILDGVTYEDGVREVIKKDLEMYKAQIETVRERVREQAEYCVKYAVDRTYLTHNRPVRVVISSQYIGKGIPSVGAMQFYDPIETRAVVQLQSENWLIAHEVGHMLSHDPETNQVGFGQHDKEEKKQNINNQFLNEGTTVLWQEDTVTNGSVNKQLEDPLELYRWYRDTTLSILREIELSKEDLYRAYFGQSEARQKLNTAIEKRFHCSMNDLEILSFSLRQPETETILSGEPFHISITDKMHASVVKKMEELARIFPNVILDRKSSNE